MVFSLIKFVTLLIYHTQMKNQKNQIILCSLIFLFSYTNQIFAQKSKLSLKDALPLSEELNEISGAIYWNGYFWAINDGGNKSYLFGLDTTTFEIKKRIYIDNSANIDWEDIAQNETHIFIGDIGNNNGSRAFLQVYKIKKSDISASIEKESFNVRASIISLQYVLKPEGKLKKHNHNFDAEAMLAIEDKLIIFSKNWERGPANVYVVDTSVGLHPLKPNCVLNTDFLVTGADYYDNKVYICGYVIDDKIEKVYVARVIPELKKDKWTVKGLHSFVPVTRQVESIALMPHSRMFLAFEQLKIGPLLIPNGALVLSIPNN